MRRIANTTIPSTTNPATTNPTTTNHSKVGFKQASRNRNILWTTLAAWALVGVGFAQTPSLEVTPQSVTSGAIAIDAITVAEDGFVVVHAYDAAGDLVLTPPLGLTYLEAGDHTEVWVELDQTLLTEYGYGATAKDVLPMLHTDANANQTYEFPEGGDVPVMVANEMVVATLPITVGPMSFMDHSAGLTPTILAASQELAMVELTLDSVTLAEDGFVVVHAFDTAGDLVLTPPLGVTYLAAGTYEDVVVGVDARLLTEYGYGADVKDVLPMLHVDANANMTYEFPEGGDVPVMVDDAMVVQNVQVSIGW